MAVYKDKTKTKDGRTWYFKVYKDKKAYKSKRYLTKAEAKEEEVLFLLKRDNPHRKPFVLIAKDYFDYLFKINKESTHYSYISSYNKHIYPYFKDFDINSIDVSVISNWASELEKQGYSVKYLNKLSTIINNIFKYAIRNYGYKDNPAKLYGRFIEKNDEIIRDREKLRYITLDEFNRFISFVDDIVWKTFFMFAYYTGCRKGEIQATTWNDIDFQTSSIHITKTLSVKTTEKFKLTNTKGKRNRTIKLNKTLLEQLKLYKQEMMKYTDFSNDWFVFGNSRFLPQTTIDRVKEKYFLLSGVPEITMHEFRHSHVSLLINEYLKSGQTDTAKFFVMMSDRLGHSIKVMQDTYMHLFPTIQDEIVDLLDNL